MRPLAMTFSIVAGCLEMPPAPQPDDVPESPSNPGTPDAGGPLTAGRRVFDETVAPILTAKCGTTACHSGAGGSPLKFLPEDHGTTYDVVVSYDDRVVGYFDKSVAPILKKIVPGPHNTSYTAAEQAAIAVWLDLELEEREGGSPPPPGDCATPGECSRKLIQEWSGCMSLAIWEEEGVAVRWANKGSSEGPCIQCHGNGQASFIATDDSPRMFEILTTNKYFLFGYFAADVTNLADARMVVNWDGLARPGNNEYPFLEHPQFAVEPGQGTYQALEAFYERTLSRKAAGLCDAPRITD